MPAKYSGSDVGRATKGAALAVLAKVYLTKASFPLKESAYYQKAVDKALEAITSGHVTGATGNFGYDLRADYSHAFLPQFKNNEEHIFSAQRASAQSQGNNDLTRTLPRGFPGIAGNYADQLHFYKNGADGNFSLYKLYSSNDKRKKVSFRATYKSPTNGLYYGSAVSNAAYPKDSIPYINKPYDPDYLGVPTQSRANVTLYRYSELLLILAEAENEANGPTGLAYQAYNKVRQRAGLANLSGLSQNQFRDSLYLDRRLELVFEYQRWFDLIRQRDDNDQPIFVKALHAVGKTNAVDRGRWFPIPQLELDNNPLLKQNPLW